MFKAHYFKYLYLSPLVLFIYMPFHIFISQWLSIYTGGLDAWKLWKDILTVVVTILFIVTIYLTKRQTKLYNLFLGVLIIYGLIHLILLKTTHQPTDTGLLAVVYNLRIFAYTLIGYSLALMVPKTDNTKRFAKILIILSTIVCIVAFLQYLLPKDLMTHFGYSIERGVKPNFFIDDKPDLPRVFSTLRDPNSLGAFLILPIVLLAQTLISRWKTQRRSLLSGLLLLHVLILFLTFSRSTLLATIIAAVSLLVLQNTKLIKTHQRKLIVALVVFILIFSATIFIGRNQYVVQNLFFHADESTKLENPNDLRVDLAKKSVKGIESQPIGHGPGTAGLVSTRLKTGGLLTEDYYLQIAYEVGIVGFLVFLALLYLIITNLWLQRKKPLVAALLSSFVGLAFASLLFHTWSNEAVAISWFFLAGTALKIKD